MLFWMNIEYKLRDDKYILWISCNVLYLKLSEIVISHVSVQYFNKGYFAYFRKAKQEDTLSYIMGHVPTRNVRGQLDEYIR